MRKSVKLRNFGFYVKNNYGKLTGTKKKREFFLREPGTNRRFGHTLRGAHGAAPAGVTSGSAPVVIESYVILKILRKISVPGGFT